MPHTPQCPSHSLPNPSHDAGRVPPAPHRDSQPRQGVSAGGAGRAPWRRPGCPACSSRSPPPRRTAPGTAVSSRPISGGTGRGSRRRPTSPAPVVTCLPPSQAVLPRHPRFDQGIAIAYPPVAGRSHADGLVGRDAQPQLDGGAGGYLLSLPQPEQPAYLPADRLSGDGAASGRSTPAGLRHPPHRTGRAPFRASGSPSDGLDPCVGNIGFSAIVVGFVHPSSGVIRSVPHPSDCPPWPCGRLSRPRTTTRALPHVRHWPKAGLLRCRRAGRASQVHLGCVCVPS